LGKDCRKKRKEFTYIWGRIQSAIEKRLLTDPVKFGIPLRSTLRGYRKLRVGDYRVIYKIEEKIVKRKNRGKFWKASIHAGFV